MKDLRRIERDLLRDIRLAAAGSVPAASDTMPLDAFIAIARSLGHEPLSCDAPFVGDGELRMIGLMAFFQRHPNGTGDSSPQSRAIELRAASQALRQSYPLPSASLLRSGLAAHTLDDPASDHSPERAESLTARAIAFARRQGEVTTAALCALGLSRQHISNLCVRGSLTRVRHGHYTAPPPRLYSGPRRPSGPFLLRMRGRSAGFAESCA